MATTVTSGQTQHFTDMAVNPSQAIQGSINEPMPRLQGRYADVNRRLIEVVRRCGEVRLPDMTIRPEMCHVIAPARGEGSAVHRHPYAELTWVEGAGVDYRRHDRGFRVEPGMLFLMPAMTMHGWECRASGSVLHGFMVAIQAATGVASRTMEEMAAAAGYRLTASRELRVAVQAMERHALDPAPGSVEVAAGYMRVALGLVFRELGRRHLRAARSSPAPAPSAAELAFLRARDYLLIHLHRNPSLAEVADLAGITPRHLNRLFVAHLGIPAGAFLRHMRLDRARHLLHERGVSVKSVARDCGFGDPAYFVRAFRRHMGVTPSAYSRHAGAGSNRAI